MIALLLVLGGTAVAATAGKHADVKADTKLIKKLAPTLTVKNANALGGAAPAAYQKAVMWAEVEGDGTISAQSGGITVSHAFTGEYYVHFGSTVAGHAISATMEWRSGQGLTSGNILAGRCGGGTGGIICVGGSGNNNTSTVYVQTDDNTNANEANRAFTVVVNP